MAVAPSRFMTQEQSICGVETLRRELREEQRRYLRENGWQYSNHNPMTLWAWTKVLPGDGRTVLTTSEDEAVLVQVELCRNHLR
jgi:hypothetical protein